MTSNQTELPRAVLDAAISIIGTSGVESLSMREVARRADVSHQAPYHYFGDRAGIFAALAEEGFLMLDAALQPALESPNPIRATAETYVHFALAHPAHFRVMFQSDICGVSTHPQTREAADKSFQSLMRLSHMANPKAANGNGVDLTPLMFWSTVHGLSTLLLDGPLLRKDNGPMRKLSAHPLNVDDIISFISATLERAFNG